MHNERYAQPARFKYRPVIHFRTFKRYVYDKHLLALSSEERAEILHTGVMTADPVPINHSTPKNPRCDLPSVHYVS